MDCRWGTSHGSLRRPSWHYDGRGADLRLQFRVSLHSAYLLMCANWFSPFSQKNIQQCRCGTASCRGVLGPKPKKPVEDKSIASTIIAGTKRKFQDIMGSVRAKSEDNQNSSKKRKLHTGISAMANAKSAGVQSEVARERAEREAAEHSRQIASRQNRALKRSIPTANARRAHLRKALPTIRSTRITTVSFPHKMPRVGALKSVKQSSRGASRQVKSVLRGSRRSHSPERPSTPTQSGSGENDSPNITPASLRSASRKSGSTTSASRGRLRRVESSVKSKSGSLRSLRACSTGGLRSQGIASKEEPEKSSAATEIVRSRNASRR
jgi:palmitoyltransferase ZDHHC9/14/18